MKLRDYQQEGVDAIRSAYKAGKRRVFYVLSTGGGKTAIFCHIASGCAAAAKESLILAHRDELISQASQRLEIHELEHGIIKAGHMFKGWMKTQVGSVATVVRRLTGLIRQPYIIVIDEGHHAFAESYKKIVAFFTGALVLYVSATPVPPKGKCIGDIADEIILGPSMKWLISEGYLLQPKVYTPICDNDFSDEELANGKKMQAAMRKRKLIGDSIKHYREICDKEPAIDFCVSIEEAEKSCEAFKEAGYKWEVVHGKKDIDHNKRCIQLLREKKIHGISACDILSEGTDIPAARVCISKRPTDSLIVAAQQWGRVLRPVYSEGHDLGTREGRLASIAASDKPFAIILDHAGNVGVNRGTFLEVRHGFPQDDREWSLNAVHKKRTKKETAIASEKIRVCLKCSVPQDPAAVCYNCGEPFGVKSRVIQVVDGKLQEVDPMENVRKVEEARNARQEVGRAKTVEELTRIAKARGYKSAWIYHMAKVKGING